MSRGLSREWKDFLEKAEFVRGLALGCLFCSEEILQEGRVVTLDDLRIPYSFH